MDERIKQLTEIDSFIHKIDAEVTLVLQNLQWDRQQILKGPEMVSCIYDKGHLIPARDKAKHEEKCLMNSQGYSAEDQLLPDPPDLSNVVKFDEMEITQILENAARNDPQFRRGPGLHGLQQPLSVDRLQSSFSSDERRAIHDAVVAAAPTQVCRDFDLKMESGKEKGTLPADRTKSHAEVLAELRDMKRRRTKYRVVAKTKNYSDALRDVIQTQMELYTEVTTIKTEPAEDMPNNMHTERTSNNDNYNRLERDRYRDPTPTLHHNRPKERDRCIARFNETEKDTRYSRGREYTRYSKSSRDRSNSHANETEKDRTIKRELNTYKTDRDRISRKDYERKDTSYSRSGYKYSESRHDRDESREPERNKRYKDERQERDRSRSKYKDREKESHCKNKYLKYD